ncbi:hypothetical protein HDV06_003820 [Boothiomyces sp. JEL0866]|nr:hypothetical protein HDV06_003820 [Boothiomyces sp. JEL0866]
MNSISNHSTLVNLFQKEGKHSKISLQDEYHTNAEVSYRSPTANDPIKNFQRNQSEISLDNEKDLINSLSGGLDTKEDYMEGKERLITIMTPNQAAKIKEIDKATPLKCRIFSAFHRIPNPSLFKVSSYYNNDICTTESKKNLIKNRIEINSEIHNKVTFIDVGNNLGFNNLFVSKGAKQNPKLNQSKKSYGKKRRIVPVGPIFNSHATSVSDKYQMVKSLYGIYNTAIPVNNFNNADTEISLLIEKTNTNNTKKGPKLTPPEDIQDYGDTKEKNILHTQTLDLNLPAEIKSKRGNAGVNVLLHKINEKSSLSQREVKRPDTTHSITLQLQLPSEATNKKLKLPAMRQSLTKFKTPTMLESSNSKISMAEILSTILPPTAEKTERLKKSMHKKKQTETGKKTHAFLIAECAIANTKFEDIQTIQLDLLNPDRPGKSEFKAVEATASTRKSDSASKLPPLKLNQELVSQKPLTVLPQNLKTLMSPLNRKQTGKKLDCINSIFGETDNEDYSGEYIDIGPWNK